MATIKGALAKSQKLEELMPCYDYRCMTCSETYELTRPMNGADEPATCSQGHVGAARLLPIFAPTGSLEVPVQSGGGCCGGGCCSS